MPELPQQEEDDDWVQVHHTPGSPVVVHHTPGTPGDQQAYEDVLATVIINKVRI